MWPGDPRQATRTREPGATHLGLSLARPFVLPCPPPMSPQTGPNPQHKTKPVPNYRVAPQLTNPFEFRAEPTAIRNQNQSDLPTVSHTRRAQPRPHRDVLPSACTPQAKTTCQAPPRAILSRGPSTDRSFLNSEPSPLPPAIKTNRIFRPSPPPLRHNPHPTAMSECCRAQPRRVRLWGGRQRQAMTAFPVEWFTTPAPAIETSYNRGPLSDPCTPTQDSSLPLLTRQAG